MNAARRSYRMTVRAEAAAETGRRIVDAARQHLNESGFDDFLLADVARSAGVSVQTLLRRFGSKEGLLEAVIEAANAEVRQSRFSAAPGELDGALAALLAHYEAWGDRVIKLLTQEDRLAIVRRVTDGGRALHAEWVDTTFAAHLAKLRPPARMRLRARLIAVTDVYVWKIFRRDLGFDERTTAVTLREFVDAVLA